VGQHFFASVRLVLDLGFCDFQVAVCLEPFSFIVGSVGLVCKLLISTLSDLICDYGLQNSCL